MAYIAIEARLYGFYIWRKIEGLQGKIAYRKSIASYLNRLSFSALRFAVARMQGYIFSHGAITPMLGNTSKYTFFLYRIKAEV